MSRIKFLLFLLALAAQVPLASATVTYAVGTCKPALHSFTTIQGALDASPPPNVVEVCPGTYNEQVVIGIPVALEGISYGNSAEAMIAPPANGTAVAKAANDFGQVVAAQVLVSNVAGEVNLTNLTVQGQSGFPSDGIRYVGVFYRLVKYAHPQDVGK
jgi:pectin methylesterase-like acyl-CoA thioesterase